MRGICVVRECCVQHSRYKVLKLLIVKIEKTACQGLDEHANWFWLMIGFVVWQDTLDAAQYSQALRNNNSPEPPILQRHQDTPGSSLAQPPPHLASKADASTSAINCQY